MLKKMQSSFLESDWCKEVSKNIWFFVVWVLLTIFFGLLGVWLPLFNDFTDEKNIILGQIIINGSISTYSIVILIEGTLNVFSTPKFKKNHFLQALIVFTAIFLIINIICYMKIINNTQTRTIKYITLISGILSTFLAVYMYQFKKIDIELGAESVVDEDNKKVEENSKNDTDNPIID